MFYSQFILAKKGPLGTIWIAAHLERKLRKNQVADTDIGVSVDSILFPDVPIALRLSSHLLLGVVRIYSRKVNYLFNDCSEALLKIKQAFRSTAVDLPPEESTAPYHSITLPETFDLDDFELPDNGFLQSNFVDHHISAREQITLQDTMDGMVYTTSQFGLDERFGDGDALQIGLDLDEDIFLQKVSPTGPSSDPLCSLQENMDPQTSGQPTTPFVDMDIHDCHDKNDDESFDPANNLHELGDDPCGRIIGSDPADREVECPTSSSDLAKCAQAPSTPGLVQEAIPASIHEVQGGIQANVDEVFSLDHLRRCSLPLDNAENSVTETSIHTEGSNENMSHQTTNTAHSPLDTETVSISTSLQDEVKSNSTVLDDMPGDQEKELPVMLSIGTSNDETQALSPEGKNILSTDGVSEGDYGNKAAFLESILENQQLSQNMAPSTMNSEIPAPEILLSAPIEVSFENSTMHKDDREFSRNAIMPSTLSGKKRHVMESTPDLSNENTRSKRNEGYIPDDNDVLASILVGRKSSLLKMKPTPPSEVTSSKRLRVTRKVSMHKRKVLMDDTMVLHGDVIRQQLTNTEDIRRVRRKAPCTRHEIWLIHKYFLEEEIFAEPLFTGFSEEISYLHQRTYDQGEVLASPVDTTCKILDSDKDKEKNNVDISTMYGVNDADHKSDCTQEQTELFLNKPLDSTKDGQSPEAGFQATLKDDADGVMIMNSDILEEVSVIDNGNNCSMSPSSKVDKSPQRSGESCLSQDQKPTIQSSDGLESNDEEIPCLDRATISEKEGQSSSTSCLGNVVNSTATANSFVASMILDDGPSDQTNMANEHVESDNAFNHNALKETEDLSKEAIDGHDSSQKNTENDPSNEHEDSKFQVGMEDHMDLEKTDIDMSEMRDSWEFDNLIGPNDTGFLNVDEDDDNGDVEREGELHDAENSTMSSTVEKELSDNNGWSSRTRAVARYLKVIFDNEECGERKKLPVDHLLVGKTRKEASRMFFETLVLKTKDYIQVEQETSFANINIQPKPKLMKSEI